ncbi:hypothetical protein L6475_01185 [Prevotella sp. E9-3]|uniref:hypothetical protein n=1 Tax=Prevotella sp. E9-3 TaxID=2913621 RepID=UPI001EDBD0E5|nr:hypothetical protein [Prevotella sp. E9-3]UKK48607.1 hypothetical protein L6475_01185 [Prevotella sp. E9-3]
MEQIINQADSLNKNGHPMTSDSLLVMACEYYDRFGTPNEQLRAHYLLGCVYRDRGEAPHAIDCFKEAINKADTTASDCDFHIMGCVYGQMAYVYHQQLLLSYEIEAYKCAAHCFILANDPIQYAIRSKVLMGDAYILLNKNDSAEMIITDAVRQLDESDDPQEALIASMSLMHLYSDIPDKTNKLNDLIHQFDTKSSLFDIHHDLPSGRRQFFYYKGKFFEAVHELDSAEYYYRKVYYSGMPEVAKVPMYRGLLSISQKRHNADSIAKYAKLYCLANDSTLNIKDRETTARMAASYNYREYQRQALINEEKASRAQLQLFVIVIAIIVVAVVAISLLRRQKRKIENLRYEYASVSDEYSRNVHRLKNLEVAHKAVIKQLQGEFNAATSELNKQIEVEKRELTEENNLLKIRIKELGHLLSLSSIVKNRQQLSETPIVKRLTELCDAPLQSLTENEKSTLLATMSDYYPSLIHDLQQPANSVTSLGVFVCILVALNYRSGEISNMLGVSPQQVANTKQDLNKSLFQVSTARSLYKNLIQRYGINTGIND